MLLEYSSMFCNDLFYGENLNTMQFLLFNNKNMINVLIYYRRILHMCRGELYTSHIFIEK